MLGAGHLLGGPGNAGHAGQGGAVEDLADVAQRDDQLLQPIQRAIVFPVQQGATVLLAGDGPAGQLDLVVLAAEQGLDGGVEYQGQGGELGGGEGALAAFGLMDGLPAPGPAYTAPMLREQIRDLAAKDVVHLVADLSAVDFLDSTGLGALIGGLKRLREAGGSLTLVIVAPRTLRLFQITGLTKVFAIHLTAAEAITADPHWQRTAETEGRSVHLWCHQHALS